MPINGLPRKLTSMWVTAGYFNRTLKIAPK